MLHGYGYGYRVGHDTGTAIRQFSKIKDTTRLLYIYIYSYYFNYIINSFYINYILKYSLVYIKYNIYCNLTQTQSGVVVIAVYMR